MLILDTDHLSALDRSNAAGKALERRLEKSGEEISATIISAEEQLRGWLAQINRCRDPDKLIVHYRRLRQRIEYFAAGIVLDWDAAAAQEFARLRELRLGVGTMDLRVASIALAVGGVLLTRNLRDFQRIPGLKAEDWLTP
jgi:tRNA(fMet)-specific endonuclease VapC